MSWAVVQVLLVSVSRVDVARLGMAALGLVFTFASIGLIGRSNVVVYRAIQNRLASWEGPRWKFVAGTLLAMVMGVPAWTTFLLMSCIAALVPEQPHPEIQTLVDAYGILFLAGEFFFLLFQITLLTTWWLVRKAPLFVAGAPRIPVKERQFIWQQARPQKPPPSS